MHWLLALLLCAPQDDLEELKKRMAAMEEEIKKLREQKPQDVEKLRKKVKDLENELEKVQVEHKKLLEQERPVILGALNPAITAFINAAARIDSKTVLGGEGEEEAKVDDRMFLRSAEVELRAPVDPYVDAVMIVKFVEEHTGEAAVELEEAYAVLKQIPILNEAPLGMRIKAGRYLAPIGQVNRIHQHDLPWTTYPLPVVEFLGSESGLGFFDAGFIAQGGGILVRPPFFEGASMDIEAHIFRAGRTRLTEESDADNPGFLGRIAFFFKPGEEHNLAASISGFFENGEFFDGLINIDLTYTWKPVGQSRYLMIGGELFIVHHEFLVETEEVDIDGNPIFEEIHTNPLGWFLFAQYQIDWHWYVGVRWDEVQSLNDEEVRTDVFAAYVSYYTSEYFRIRLGYEYRWSDIEAQDDVHTLMLELNLVFGAHPPEPWWVNR